MRAVTLALPALLVGCSLAIDVERFDRGGDDAGAQVDAAIDTGERFEGSAPDRGVDSTAPGDAVAEAETSAKPRPQVFIAGGNVEGVNEPTVLRGELSESGEIAAWTSAPDLPSSATSTQATRSGARVYILGPDFVGGNAVTVRFASFDAAGKLSAWSAQKTLTARARVAAASTDTFLYAIGGVGTTDSTGSTDVFVATIQSDGSPGAFSAARALPVARAGACAVTLGDNLYVFGGYTESTTGHSSVIRAPIAADGSLGAWVTQGSLLFTSSGCSAVAVGKRMFVFGGYGALDKVQHALVGSSGDLAPFVSGNMPSPHAYFQAVVAGGYVVVAAGHAAGTDRTAQVDVAAISESGVGTWKTTTPLPKARTFVNAFGSD